MFRKTFRRSMPGHVPVKSPQNSRVANRFKMDLGDWLGHDGINNVKKNNSNFKFTKAHERAKKTGYQGGDLYEHYREHLQQFKEPPKILRRDVMHRYSEQKIIEEKSWWDKLKGNFSRQGWDTASDLSRKISPPCQRDIKKDPTWMQKGYENDDYFTSEDFWNNLLDK
jgi:hypothetical protein